MTQPTQCAELPGHEGDDAVVQLAAAICNIESISGREHMKARAVAAWLEARGWDVLLQPIEGATPEDEERYNVLARRQRSKAGPLVVLNTHLDTVPPFYPAVIDRAEGVLRGRGACDTGGILAAQLVAAQRLAEAGEADDLALLFVVDEETTHLGMKRANDLKLEVKYLVVGEPTDLRMIRSQKGILKLRVVARGVACHSGYPDLGTSAIDLLLDVLHDLRRAPWPSSPTLGDTTLNIGLISGGQAANALAARAEATLMFRVISEPQDVLGQVLRVVGERDVGLEPISSNAPVVLGTLPGYDTAVAAFNTDVPYLQLASGGVAYLIGPGSIHDAHSSHEHIKIADLHQAVEVYMKLCRQLCQQI